MPIEADVVADRPRSPRDQKPPAIAPRHRHQRADEVFVGDALDLKARRELKAVEIAQRDGDRLPGRIGMRPDDFDRLPLAVVEMGLEPRVAFGRLARRLPIAPRIAGDALPALPADFSIDEQPGFAGAIHGLDGEDVRPAADDAAQVEEEALLAAPLPDLSAVDP